MVGPSCFRFVRFRHASPVVYPKSSHRPLEAAQYLRILAYPDYRTPPHKARYNKVRHSADVLPPRPHFPCSAFAFRKFAITKGRISLNSRKFLSSAGAFMLLATSLPIGVAGPQAQVLGLAPTDAAAAEPQAQFP